MANVIEPLLVRSFYSSSSEQLLDEGSATEVECGVAVVVLGVLVRAHLKQHLRDIVVALVAGEDERDLGAVIGGGHWSTCTYLKHYNCIDIIYRRF